MMNSPDSGKCCTCMGTVLDGGEYVYWKSRRARTVRAKAPHNKLHGKMPIMCGDCPIIRVCKHPGKRGAECINVWTALKRHFAM
jgi:hypothetical protein